MKKSVIEIHNLDFSYEKLSVLKQIDLTVYEKEFIGVFGPNGGGKTTLLKLLMGFLNPTSGSIHLFNQSPIKARKKIGYVPQTMQFDKQFPLTVFETVLMGALSSLNLFGRYPKKAKEDALFSLERVGLVDLKDRQFGSLSGGQTQRVLIARALMGNPKLLLLDEPTACVDTHAEEQITSLLSVLGKELTILLVTHDLDTILEKADRFLCIHGDLTALTERQSAPILHRGFITNRYRTIHMNELAFFLQMALIAGSLASVTSGIIGSYVVVKRILFIAGSISHSVLGGMGLFLWLKRTYDIAWITPIQGALIAAIISAFLIGWVRLRYKEREDTVIAALWSTGMAIGVIFTSLTPGYNVELMNFLFGNILWVSTEDIILLAALDVLVIGITLLFHKRFMAICFDEKQALLQGLNVPALTFLLLVLIALSIVLLIQVVGSILVIAMLTLPAAIAGGFTARLSRMMGIAIALNALFTFLGIGLSYQLNWPTGATISLTAALFYALYLFFTTQKKRASLPS